MKKYSIFLLIILSSLIACNQGTGEQASGDGQEVNANEQQDASDAGEQNQFFGELIESEGAIKLSDLLQQMEESDSILTKVHGKVDAVCQTKGCWMSLTTGEGEEIQELFVQFKDYGFFMPKDIGGREVIIEGLAYRSVTSVEELKHYAEDDGQSAEEIAAITEPLEELKFLANGVILLDEK